MQIRRQPDAALPIDGSLVQATQEGAIERQPRRHPGQAAPAAHALPVPAASSPGAAATSSPSAKPQLGQTSHHHHRPTAGPHPRKIRIARQRPGHADAQLAGMAIVACPRAARRRTGSVSQVSSSAPIRATLPSPPPCICPHVQAPRRRSGCPRPAAVACGSCPTGAAEAPLRPSRLASGVRCSQANPPLSTVLAEKADAGTIAGLRLRRMRAGAGQHRHRSPCQDAVHAHRAARGSKQCAPDEAGQRCASAYSRPPRTAATWASSHCADVARGLSG